MMTKNTPFPNRIACPACGGLRSDVVDSRGTQKGHHIRRRRKCKVCYTNFTTNERLASTELILTIEELEGLLRISRAITRRLEALQEPEDELL